MIDRNGIITHCAAATPEQAIIAAGEALRETGACNGGYVQAMVDNFRQFGPYFVIAPGAPDNAAGVRPRRERSGIGSDRALGNQQQQPYCADTADRHRACRHAKTRSPADQPRS